MNLTIRARLTILAILPVLLISISLIFMVRAELDSLSQTQIEATREKLIEQFGTARALLL